MEICPSILKRNSGPWVYRAHARVSFKEHSLKSVDFTCVAKSLNESILKQAVVESLCFMVDMKGPKTELLPTKLENNKAHLNKKKKDSSILKNTQKCDLCITVITLCETHNRICFQPVWGSYICYQNVPNFRSKSVNTLDVLSG